MANAAGQRLRLERGLVAHGRRSAHRRAAALELLRIWLEITSRVATRTRSARARHAAGVAGCQVPGVRPARLRPVRRTKSLAHRRQGELSLNRKLPGGGGSAKAQPAHPPGQCGRPRGRLLRIVRARPARPQRPRAAGVGQEQPPTRGRAGALVRDGDGPAGGWPCVGAGAAPEEPPGTLGPSSHPPCHGDAAPAQGQGAVAH